MSEDTQQYGVEAWLTRIRNAVGQTPIDWDAIRGAAMSLDGEAKTKDQKTAVERLKRAAASAEIHRAISAVDRAFLNGTSGVDGWPRKA